MFLPSVTGLTLVLASRVMGLVPESQDVDNQVVTDRDGGHHHTEHVPVEEYSGDHGDSGIREAVVRLDKQFLYLLSRVSGLADPTARDLASSCNSARLKTQTYGWGLIIGSLEDVAADYIGNNRMPLDLVTMPDVIYSNGFNIGYGLGFAGPYMLPTYLGNCFDFTCSTQDFLAVVDSYSLRQGLAGQYIGEAKLYNFGVDAKQALDCIIQQKGDSKEAYEVELAIEDMVEAAVQRLRLSKQLKYVR